MAGRLRETHSNEVERRGANPCGIYCNLKSRRASFLLTSARSIACGCRDLNVLSVRIEDPLQPLPEGGQLQAAARQQEPVDHPHAAYMPRLCMCRQAQQIAEAIVPSKGTASLRCSGAYPQDL